MRRFPCGGGGWTVVQRIDMLEREGQEQQAEQLRHTLNNQSVGAITDSHSSRNREQRGGAMKQVTEERPALPTAEERFLKLCCRLIGLNSLKGRREMADREVVITPYGGAYGVAGVVVAVEGSPPRGTFLVPIDAIRSGDDVIVYTDGWRLRRFRPYDYTYDFMAVVHYVRTRCPELLLRPVS